MDRGPDHAPLLQGRRGETRWGSHDPSLSVAEVLRIRTHTVTRLDRDAGHTPCATGLGGQESAKGRKNLLSGLSTSRLP